MGTLIGLGCIEKRQISIPIKNKNKKQVTASDLLSYTSTNSLTQNAFD